MNKKSAVKFLSQLRQLNIQVIAEGEKLRYQAPKGVLTPELRQEIAEYKAEILAFLSTVNRNERSAPSAIEIIPRNENLPLSFGQERLWILDQLQGSTAYNEHGGIRITGKLDVTAIQFAFAEVLRRHEALRTTFPLVNGKPVQAIAPKVKAEVAHIDWQHLTESARETELQHYAQQQAQTLFDLAEGPLVCATLVHLAAEEWVLLIVMHHIICDYWSINIFIQELATLYQSFSQRQPSPLPELVIQYADYAHWQRHRLNGELLETQLSYWKKELAGAPSLLQLPSDRPRPSVQSYRGENQTFILEQSLTKKLQQLNQAFGTTLFMTLLTAFSTLLYRYSNQEDILIGSPIANRTRSEIEPLIGFIANVLVLRVRFQDNLSFAQLLEQVQSVTLQGYAHQDMPFEQVVEALQLERSLSYSPLYQIMFVFQNVPKEPLVLPGVTLKPFTPETQTAKFDLSLMMEESDQGLIGIWKYNTDLFNKETIARMTEHFQILLSAIVSDPLQPVSQLPLLSEQERYQLLVEWNQTAADYPQDKCIHQLFEEQVQRTPDVVAVVYEDQILTYRELNNRANQLAHYLQGLGVGAEILVGICVERSFAMVVGLLGILKAGGAYVPLDPTYPQERLRYMLDDSGALLLLTQQKLLDLLPPHSKGAVCLDTDWQSIAAQSTDNFVSDATAKNLAYVIYTSGSTGKPKGVAIEHHSTVALLDWAQDVFTPKQLTGVLASTSICFDLSVFELFLPLSVGGKVILAENGLHLPTISAAKEVTLINTVPSVVAELIRTNSIPNQVCTVNLAGEPLQNQLVQQLYQQVTIEKVFNLYGPSEDTTYSTFALCVGEEEQHAIASFSINIGRAIANTQIYILDRHLQPQPIGVPGEIYIGGAGLARCYFNRPELTAQKFIPSPFGNQLSSRLYKTGDLARYLPDAKIQFLGRIDNQVKIRGFRIELGEIETVLIAHPLVQQAIVIDREDTPNKKSLVAYIVAQQNSFRSSELFSFLKQKLPDYMVPKYFVILDALPLTPNGKVDRKALPAPLADLVREGEFVPPQTPIELTLAAIWQEVLEVSQVGIHDNFFAIGGDSILSIQVVSRAKQIGIQITPKQLFQYQTVAELATVANTATSVLAQQEVVTGEVPLTPIQKWFFEQNWSEPHHFNQSVLLRLPNNFNPSFLSKAVKQLLQHHDALRLRFICHAENWQQINYGLEDTVPFEQVDLSQVPQSQQIKAFEEIAAARQASLNLNIGPLMRVVLFNLGSSSEGRLLIIIHHLAVDGVSWRILLEDLFAVYQQLERGESIQLQKKTTAFQDWAIRLNNYAQSNILHQQLNYWLNLPWTKVAPLPVDEPAKKQYNIVANAAEVSVALDEEQTNALLTEVSAAYNTQINDVLVTALAQSLRKWTGKSAFLIDLEGHGREDLFEEVDLSRTIGWFTSIFPVLLHLESTTDLGETLKAVKEQLRGIPERGIGYGILRYLSQENEICTQLQALPQADIRFNYFGQFAQEEFLGVSWQFDAMSKHFDRSSEGSRPYLLDVNAMVVEGKLQITWTYCCQIHHSATVKQLAHNYIEELQKLIDHCLSPEAKGYTPSDFPEAGLSQQQLDTLLAGIEL